MRFPLVGSAVLITLFACFKFFSKDLVNKVLALYFVVLGVFSLTQLVHPFAAPLFPLSARAARRAARAPRALRHLKMAYSETNTREPLHVRNGRGEKSETSGSAYATSDNANCPPLNCAPQHHMCAALLTGDTTH